MAKEKAANVPALNAMESEPEMSPLPKCALMKESRSSSDDASNPACGSRIGGSSWPRPVVYYTFHKVWCVSEGQGEYYTSSLGERGISHRGHVVCGEPLDRYICKHVAWSWCPHSPTLTLGSSRLKVSRQIAQTSSSGASLAVSTLARVELSLSSFVLPA